MAKLSDVQIPSLLFAEQGSDPAAPASGLGRLYLKADGVYFIDDAGAVTGPFAESTTGLVIASASAVLTNHTPNNLTLEQWGTEEAVVAQADAPASAVVLAWLTGAMAAGPGTISANDRGLYQMEVSFDGGSSFATIGVANAASLPTTQTSRNYTISSTGRATGTVTGDIQVRAMVADLSAANDTTWLGGVITVLVHPQ